jgi:hypothetical protein
MAQSYNFPLGITRHDPNFVKILQIIESYRGYETLTDLKVADEQVRKHLGQQLQKAAGESIGAREKIELGMHLRILPDFDDMVKLIHKDREEFKDYLQEKIAACHVYRPEADPVRELYMLDYTVLSGVENVYNLMQEFARIKEEDLMITNIHKINVSLHDIADSMKKRGQIIGCMIG